jgi:hypothetical protein
MSLTPEQRELIEFLARAAWRRLKEPRTLPQQQPAAPPLPDRLPAA